MHTSSTSGRWNELRGRPPRVARGGMGCGVARLDGGRRLLGHAAVSLLRRPRPAAVAVALGGEHARGGSPKPPAPQPAPLRARVNPLFYNLPAKELLTGNLKHRPPNRCAVIKGCPNRRGCAGCARRHEAGENRPVSPTALSRGPRLALGCEEGQSQPADVQGNARQRGVPAHHADWRN